MLKLIQARPAGGDGCAPYDVRLDKAYDVRSFVEEVLSTFPRDWGEFTIHRDNDQKPTGASYRYGSIVGKPLADAVADSHVARVNAHGGWSYMRYIIFLRPATII